ncbi:S-layer homology domain-containing protein [Radiobacillus sp. PE A8.2]|uniref:S-layer homology domain-containing protein n=1 Tax=Radiobacillus sp. PE A8.2 TaxID=3380349 RepID=UPI00389029F9
MSNSWEFIIDFTWLSLFIAVAAVLKARIPALQRFIIPTSMIAGFMGLIVGPEVIGWISFDLDRLGDLVYHLMAIGFIALSLKERNVEKKPGMLNAGMFIVSTYLVQGVLGFGILLILMMTIYPDIFPGVGLLLPLGFGQGPGQAYSIGTQWEQLGLTGGGNLGLTIAGIGFIWATVIGIILMNILTKNKRYTSNSTSNAAHHDKVIEELEPDEIPLSDAMDKLSFQMALIGVIYLVTYLTIVGLGNVLTPLGTYGETFSQLLMGFHFIIGSLYAILFRWILNRLRDKGVHLEHKPNNYLLQRISGFSFDYMIAASISAISIYALREYAFVVLLLTTVGGAATIFFTVWLCPRLFPQDKIPNVLGFYGMLTGTISTGMALVKAVDPKFKSNATENMVMGSATAIMFGIPLLLILNIPIVGYVEQKPILYVYTFFALVAYLFMLMTIMHFRVKKQK